MTSISKRTFAQYLETANVKCNSWANRMNCEHVRNRNKA